MILGLCWKVVSPRVGNPLPFNPNLNLNSQFSTSGHDYTLFGRDWDPSVPVIHPSKPVKLQEPILCNLPRSEAIANGCAHHHLSPTCQHTLLPQAT